MPKNVQMPDGTVIAFPDNMDDATIHAEGLKYINKVMAPPPPVDQRALNAQQVKPIGDSNASSYLTSPKGNFATDALIENVLRPTLPKMGAVAAGAAVAPYTGGMGSVPAGALAYGGIDALLQKLKTKQEPGMLSSLLGSKPGSAQDTVLNTLEQAALMKAGEKVIGGTWKAIKAFNAADQPEILKFLPTASQALKAEGKMPTTATILKYVEDHFAPGTKQAAQEASAKESSQLGFKQAAKIAGRSPSTVQDPQTMAQLISEELVPEKTIVGGTNKIASYATDPASMDKLIANPVRLQDALTKSQGSGAGINARQDLGAYRLARLQQDASIVGPDGVTKIDPMKIAASLNDPEMAASNKLLFNSKQLSNIQQFYKNVAATQDKSQGFGGFGKLRLAMEGIGLSGSIAHALITGNAAPVAVALAPIGVEFGVAGVAKALTNPKTARLMLALANNDALGVSDQYAARILMQTLTNATGNLVNKDGSKTPFVVKQGQMVPVGQ